MTDTHQILLYYQYFPIADAQQFWADHKTLCQRLWLFWRIIIAEEWINGTVEWLPEATQKYMEHLQAIPWCEKINFKKSGSDGKAFTKLQIRVRDQIVTLNDGDEDLWPVWWTTGKYLSADELYKWYEEDREFYIVDMRNDYETEVGHFINSICPEWFYNFRNLPDVLPQIEHLRGKTVVTVCTWWIRCEKASWFLLKNWFADVYQLHNGIVTFMEKFPNEYFKWKLYVFDQRYTMWFNTDSPDHEVIGKCRNCWIETEHYVNRYEWERRNHGLMCETCCTDGSINVQIPGKIPAMKETV